MQGETEALLVDFVNQRVIEHESDAIILGRAPIAGLAAEVRERVCAPLVNSTHNCVGTADEAGGLATCRSMAAGCCLGWKRQVQRRSAVSVNAYFEVRYWMNSCRKKNAT